MNNIRKFFCVLTAVVLAALAPPIIAAPQLVKVYDLHVTSAPNTPLQVVADLQNVSPNGNSTISSFSLTITGSTILSVDSLTSGKAAIDATHSSVTISSMSPL